jgi:hypothetical protein
MGWTAPAKASRPFRHESCVEKVREVAPLASGPMTGAEIVNTGSFKLPGTDKFITSHYQSPVPWIASPFELRERRRIRQLLPPRRRSTDSPRSVSTFALEARLGVRLFDRTTEGGPGKLERDIWIMPAILGRLDKQTAVSRPSSMVGRHRSAP